MYWKKTISYTKPLINEPKTYTINELKNAEYSNEKLIVFIFVVKFVRKLEILTKAVVYDCRTQNQISDYNSKINY